MIWIKLSLLSPAARPRKRSQRDKWGEIVRHRAGMTSVVMAALARACPGHPRLACSRLPSQMTSVCSAVIMMMREENDSTTNTELSRRPS